MRNIFLTILFCASTFTALAQKPHYLPGDGVYIVGLPADMSKTYNYPVMVTEAYQATFKTTGAELASISAGKSYNISSRLQDDGTLDLISFMGCGEANNLVVRNYDGESYSIGDYAPEKTWSQSYLVAAHAPWDGKSFYTLGVYDHWDCPVTNNEDPMFTERNANGLTVDFGNPHEGLVVNSVNFNLVSDDASLANKLGALKVKINIYDDNRESVLRTETKTVNTEDVEIVGTTEDGKTIYSVYVYYNRQLILAQPFTIGVEGFEQLQAHAWIPRAVDTHNLYPTHTTYHLASGDVTVTESDACINVDGYFNYVGSWGWYDGKCEYGECVAQGDYVQVYIDPSDPDWPGMFFTGDPTFPVECAFGANDLALEERPDWVNQIEIETSQWDEYGALLIIMQAEALPTNETGRYGKVVITTKDDASKYTIHIRQGNGSFPDGISGPVITIPAEGGYYDLSGRRISEPQVGQIFIHNGKKYINK